MVKIFTTQKHRFGRTLTIGNGVAVVIDGKGNAEIDEANVAVALISGFELFDKTLKFKTEEEQAHIDEVQSVLESAKLQAEEIVKEAEKKAKEIIADAEKKANVILAEGHVNEKEAKRDELGSKTVKELQALAIEAGIEEGKYKGLKKEALVDLLISYIFEEEK